MNQLSESKILKRWIYTIGFIVLAGITIWQLAPILQAFTKLIEVLK